MEVKKNKKYDVRDKRMDFFLFGLAAVVLMILGAFNYKSYDNKNNEVTRVVIEEEIVVMENTVQEKKPPPPPPPPELEIVEDDEEIPEEQEEIDDSETDQDEEIELVEQEDDDEEVEETNEIFEMYDVSEVAFFKDGGEEGLLKFIAENLKYPEMAVENEIQGLVMLQFVVTKKGEIGEIQLLSGKKGFGLEKEAIRVIKLTSGQWSPAKQRENPVNVRFRVPVNFKLY